MSLNKLFDRVREKNKKKRHNDTQQQPSSRDNSPTTPPTATYKKIHNSGQGQKITFESVKIDFPLRPYAAQVQMMNKMIHAFNNGENALLESPTGSGKSLAIICAALAWREHQERIAAAEIKGQKEKSTATALPPAESHLLLERTNGLQESRKRKVEPIGSSPSAATSSEMAQPSPSKKIKEDSSGPEAGIMPLWDDKENDDDDFQVPLVKRKVDPKIAGKQLEIEQASATADRDVSEQKLAPPEEAATLKYDTYKKVPRIFIGSRTHKQIAQLVAELKYNTGYNPRSTILGSREHLCIHPGSKKNKEKKKGKGRADRVSLEEEEEKCPFAVNSNRIVSHSSLKTSNRVWEIDDLIKLGEKTRGCPYYAARKLYEGAEVIFGPYNYIIDPVIRKILDINLKDSIVILDEAHNIEDAARSAGSLELSEDALDKMIKEFSIVAKYGGEKEAHRDLEMIFDDLRNSIMSDDIVYTVQEYERKSCHWTGQDIVKKLAEVNITKHTFEAKIEPAYKLVSAYSDEIRKDLEEVEFQKKYNVMSEELGNEAENNNDYLKCVSLPTLQLIQNLFMILRFIFDTEETHANDYQLVYTKELNHDGGFNINRGNNKKGKSRVSLWKHEMAFWCLNPSIIFRNMCANTRSVILTSGTLAPLNTFASELGVDFNGRLEANHVIKSSQVWISAIGRGPNNVSLKGVYSTLESLPYQDEVGATLLHIVQAIPFGILCFVPSYKVMDMLLKRWKLTGVYDRISEKKMILSEPKGSNKEEFEEMLKQFYGQIKRIENEEETGGQNGVLLFAVFRGKVSEGIDFSDNYCRAVVTLGIPYPGLKDLKVKLKKEYNDKVKRQAIGKEVLNGNQWYTAEAYRAMNQALGRCIRHKNDWGAIILLDERFASPDARKGLSRWVRDSFFEHHGYQNAMGSLAEFAENQMERMRAQKLESKRIEEEKVKNTIVIESQQTTILDDKNIIVSEDQVIELDTNVEDASCVIMGSKDADASVQIIEQESLVDMHNEFEDFQTNVNDEDVKSEIGRASTYLYDTLQYDGLNNNVERFDVNNDTSKDHVASGPADINDIKREMTAMPSDTELLIRCKSCSRELLSGPSDSTIESMILAPSIGKELNDDTSLELVSPNDFSITPNNALLGGPITLEDFPEKREDVIFAHEDGIAFCRLMCKCDKNTVIGVVVCLTDERHSQYQREVIFGRQKVVIDRFSRSRSGSENVRTTEDELFSSKAKTPRVKNMLEIPDTQYSAMSDTSDIFFGL